MATLLLSGVGQSGPTTSTWTPITAGSAFWYDASQPSVYTDNGTTLATNGQAVQQWNDLSGNSRHLQQSSSALKPSYDTGILNGMPVVSLNWGVNTQTNGMDTASTWTGTLPQPFFLMTVFQYRTPALFPLLVNGSVSGAAHRAFIDTYQNAASGPCLNFSAVSISTILTVGNNYMLYGYFGNGASDDTIKASGITAVTGDMAETAGITDGIQFGYTANTTNFGNSENQRVGEMFAFATSGGLADPNIASAVSYVTAKWAVSS